MKMYYTVQDNAEKQARIIEKWNQLLFKAQNGDQGAIAEMNEAYRDALSLVPSGLLNFVELGRDS